MGRSGKRREKKAKIDSQKEWSKKEGKFWRKKPGCVKRKKEKFVKKMKLKKKWRQEETSWKTPQRNRKLTKRSRSKMKIFCWKKNTKYRRITRTSDLKNYWRLKREFDFLQVRSKSQRFQICWNYILEWKKKKHRESFIFYLRRNFRFWTVRVKRTVFFGNELSSPFETIIRFQQATSFPSTNFLYRLHGLITVEQFDAVVFQCLFVGRLSMNTFTCLLCSHGLVLSRECVAWQYQINSCV